MELREIYETLLRRGMPEHPRLLSCFWPEQGHYWAQPNPELLSSAPGPTIAADDACDLITMRALRWVNSFPLSMKLKCAHYCLGAATESLEDILLTTIPLEPKKTLA